MSPATIIIVEDDSGTRRTLRGILEDAGYQVIDAENAADALETIRKSSCDLVITDIRLPDASGMEVLRQVREITPDVVVIIMTGYASVETAVAAVEHGAYAYFIKPVNPDELTINIANALKQQRLIRENRRLLDNLQRTNKKLRQEVSEHKRAEKALRRSEQRYRSLVNNVQLGIIRSTPGPPGRILEVNPAMEKITGYSRDELLAMDMEELYVHLEERRAFMEELASAKGAVTRELSWRNKDGSEIAVLDTVIAVRDDTGNVLHFDAIIEDITERKRTTEALQKSEEKYRSLVNNVKLGILRSKPGIILEVNPAFEEITGYSRDELLAMDIRELYVNLEEREALLKEVASAKRAVTWELRWRKKDGSEIVVLDTVITVRDDAGKILHFDAIIEDITERKRAEEALRESEARLAEAQSIAHIGSWAWDTLKNEICYSDEFHRIFGRHLRNLETFLDSLHPDDRKFVEKSVNEALRANRPYDIDYRIILPNEAERVIHAQGAVNFDNTGKPIRMVGTVQDITERKRAEEALRQSEEKYRTLVENAADFIYMVDAHDRILSLNQSTARILGREPEELIGKKAFDILPPEMATQFAEEFRLTFKTGKTIMADTKIGAGGAETWASTSLSPIRNDSGEVVAVMGVTRDITEQKRLERELQEKNEQLDTQNEELRVQSEELVAQQQELFESTEEAARANQLKSEFLANMSHELRTPLNAIIGFSQLMRDEVPGKINQEQKQCLDDVMESSQHLVNLINEVLNLSKIESGRVELKLENVALAELIKPLTRSMMPILGPKKQSLDVEIEEGLPPVHVDKGKLGQVLRNLLANSSKFTLDGGKLKIEATSGDGWLQLRVIDNGIGIKKEDQERIFEPFCQLDYTPGNGKGGTGLGLAVVKQIVERHGGQIRVESEYGRGSRFTISLPLATQ